MIACHQYGEFGITIKVATILSNSVVVSKTNPTDLKQLFVFGSVNRQNPSSVSGVALQIEWSGFFGHLPDFTIWMIGQGVPRSDKGKQYWIYESDRLMINDCFRTDPPHLLVFAVKSSPIQEETIIQARKPHLDENQL
jgi:hypothetical protein